MEQGHLATGHDAARTDLEPALAAVAQKTTLAFSDRDGVCVSLPQVAAGQYRIICQEEPGSQQVDYRSFVITADETKVFHTCPYTQGEEKSFRGDFPRDWGYCSESAIRQESVLGTALGFKAEAFARIDLTPQLDCEEKRKSMAKSEANRKVGRDLDCKNSK